MYMVLLNILIILYKDTLHLVCGNGITKPAYLGFRWQKYYVVHSEEQTWLDARNVCKSNGFSLQYNKWKDINWYIKIKAERRGWNTSDDVWLGMYKHPNSSSWYLVKEDKCEEVNITLPGQLFQERQCAVLNMSGPSYSGNSRVIYAEDCEGRTLGFVCLFSYGDVLKDMELYHMSEMTEKGTFHKSWENVNMTDCAINSFSIFNCYAATYFQETDICNAECTNMDNIPDNVTIVKSFVNSTVLLRTSNKVLINKTVTYLHPMDTGQFPCLSDTSTSTDSTSVWAGVSTLDYVTEMYSQCLCICTTQSNISTDVLQQKISQIKKNLTITITSLSSSVRKKISAPDMRQSSFAMGIVGMCVIVGTIVALTAGDVFHAVFITVKFLKTRKRNI